MKAEKLRKRAARLGHTAKPALVEALLLTAKRAQDCLYLARLAQELRAIEAAIAIAENTLHIAPHCTEETPPNFADPVWIHDKSVELRQRLGRIERADEVNLGTTVDVCGHNQPRSSGCASRFR